MIHAPRNFLSVVLVGLYLVSAVAAQQRAELPLITVTGEIGQKIGRAYSIEEEVATRDPASQNSSRSNTITTAGDDSPETDGTRLLGQLTVNARVTVRFILE